MPPPTLRSVQGDNGSTSTPLCGGRERLGSAKRFCDAPQLWVGTGPVHSSLLEKDGRSMLDQWVAAPLLHSHALFSINGDQGDHE